MLHAPVRQVIVSADFEHVPNSVTPQIEERISLPSEVPPSPSVVVEPQAIISESTLPEPVNEDDDSSVAQVAEYGEPVTFNLAIMISGNYVLLDGVDGRIDPVVRELKHKLAENIMKIFHSNIPQFYELSWPLFDHPDAPKDAPTAREYVQSKLRTFIEHDNVTLIICGKVAEQYCIGNNHKPGDSLNSEMGRCLVTFSLSQLLSSPKMKREFYQFLIPLLKDED
ncbi:hypothetical protein [Gynuella sunshinyii]|uniref:Uracil-DNA glycosylase-like domain-containing protein n=1 Tax=Gynuella sunshinyii YC6258 TaxID=1445510 RepID=A0A0C5VT78_9GAMM|nr:hypothetical protein [Gynuella sunshinyii]AJQ97391.1 hypothetical Protein YC6258_05361 [Gynuella sunshinyii YC6258]